MKSSRTPWISKVRPELEPKVVPAQGGKGRLLVPTPLLVRMLRGTWRVAGFRERAR
jgi:hypothetical protein